MPISICQESTPPAPRPLLLQNDEWAAPPLWRSEFRNILATYLRRNDLTFSQVLAIQREAEALLGPHEYLIDSSAVLELVRISPCSAYDCEFVALAHMLDAPLFTMDGKLLRAFPECARELPCPQP